MGDGGGGEGFDAVPGFGGSEGFAGVGCWVEVEGGLDGGGDGVVPGFGGEGVGGAAGDEAAVGGEGLECVHVVEEVG